MIWGLINVGFQFKIPFINELSPNRRNCKLHFNHNFCKRTNPGLELKQMLIWTRIYLTQNSEEENANSKKNKERSGWIATIGK